MLLRRLTNKRGNILLFTVLMVLPMLLVFAGLATDMAYYGNIDNELQRAMDSAALAGAGRVLLLGAGPVGIELAGEIKAVWPGKQVTLVDVAGDVLGERYRPDLKAELRRQLTDLGAVPYGNTPAQFATLIDNDRKRYARIISERKISVD